MTKRSIQVVFHALAVWTVVAALGAVSLYGEGPRTEYDFYTAPEGTSYVVVGLRGVAIPTAAANEVVFLVDTSAAQIGQNRQDTLSALRSTINHLPAGSLVRIYAMDVETEELTPTFVEKGSAELNAAIQRLERRVPLGATDMMKGLQTAKTAFDGRDAGGKRSVLYLGDGYSMARTVDVPDFEREVKDYVARRIPFTACTVGARSNLGLVGAFANQTGGNLVDLNTRVRAGVERALETAESQAEARARAEGRNLEQVMEETFVEMPDFGQSVGRQLASAATATVVWPDPQSYSMPEGWEVYPKKLQPIRSDRDTIFVGKTDSTKLVPFKFQLKGDTPGNEMELAWNLIPNKAPGSHAGNKFLAAVVDTAARDDGLTMPIVGWDTVELVQEGFIANIDDRLSKAEAAIKIGDPTQALHILNGVLKLDPNNGAAQRLHDIARDGADNAPGGGSGDVAAPAPTPAPRMVDSVTWEQSALTQKIQNEVTQTIRDASARVNDDPEGALQNLRMTMAMVRNNTALEPSQRNAMLDSLGNTLRQAQHTQYLNEYKQQRLDEKLAAEQDRRSALNDLEERRVKVIQIFDRFNALMSAKEYKIAVGVANVAAEMLPDDSTPFTAERLASMVSYITEYEDLRHQRHIGFVESLMVAERSFIPIPEEPPITYIDPEKWLLLSDRRKERYSVADLSQSGPAEKKINRALEKNIDLELDENQTFEDLFNMITDKNPGLNIGIDPKGAGALGITTSSPVVREPVRYHGIKLRNALRLILSEQDLTYCIKNEVLLITSEEEAKKYMSIKVYPMADLVVDPTPIGGGMSGGSGMSGGGSMGSMMNGGGSSMGGGSSGGGMWSVPETMRRMYGAGLLNGKPANGFSSGYSGGVFSVPQENLPRKKAGSAKDKTPRSAVNEAMAAPDARAFWDGFFATEQPDEQFVQSVVQLLLNDLKAGRSRDHSIENRIVALVESAILADAVQPWMYEAMALSLYLKGAPEKELERAVLSAAAFCENPIDLMNIGLFMRSLGLKQRAFQMYKQSLEAMIPKREFFSTTLGLAQELYLDSGVEDPLRWIALNVLSQEWEGEAGRKMTESALDSLLLLKRKMERAGRSEEALVLNREIEEARLRDCIVTVEWTGNAGLDLMVREPTDTYCWFGSPRTLSGGLLKTAPAAANGTLTEQSGLKRMTYVCPKGFNGRYAVIVQKEWGEPTNNMIKLAVETGVAGGNTTRQGSACQLSPEGVIVYFDLENGRREEGIEEAVADVATIQMSVAQQQLDRNNALRRLSDVGTLAQVLGTGGSGEIFTPVTSQTSSSRSRNAYPIYGQSVVGYRPVITVLPDGAQLESNAVVSADRRYVRISPYPMFSSIRRVYSYNMMTGLDDAESGMGSGTGGSSSF